MNVIGMSPNTTIKLLHNVSLDSTYRDTFYFASASAQLSFFNQKVKYTVSNAAPVRMQQAIRVPIEADLLYDCNYLMFQNLNFSGKWFYAFITRIDFINPSLSLIHYSLDVMQSWAFDYTIKPSYVEREHAANDAIGANLVPERLPLGDYVLNSFNKISQLNSKVIGIASTVDASNNPVQGAYYSGIYSGVHYYFFADAASANDYITALTDENKANAIVSVFMMASYFADNATPNVPKSLHVEYTKQYGNVDGYVPKNNKLFTYPYNFLYVATTDGSSAHYPYEYFSGDSCGFNLWGSIATNPEIIMVPVNFKGATNNFNEQISIGNFPQCTFNIDSFRQWLAQNGLAYTFGMMGSFLNVGTQAAGENYGGAISSGINTLQSIANFKSISEQPPHAKGGGTGSINFAVGNKNFFVGNMSIRYEFAKIIDDYFSMYGYATHELKVPNTHSRRSWNYVKTVNSSVVGSIPFEDIVTIRANFDKGITFWMGDFVGDYTRNNAPA